MDDILDEELNNNIILEEVSYIGNWNLKEHLFFNYRCIKTIFYLLKQIQLNDYNYRNKCYCCDNIINSNILTNNIIVSLIKKINDVINFLPCGCTFDKNKITILTDYYNYKNYNITITDNLPEILKILLLTHTKTQNLMLININRCIHEDIKNNNIIYCKNKNNIITPIDNELNYIYNIYEFIKNSKQIIDKLIIEQNITIFKNIKNNHYEYFNKLFIKQNYSININSFVENNYKILFKINETILIKIFLLIIDEIKNDNNFQNILSLLIEVSINEKKFELCIHFCMVYTKMNDSIINNILCSNINISLKQLFINKYKNYNELINLIIISNNDELFIENLLCIYPEKSLDLCIINNNLIGFKYILNNYKINNPYINIFNNCNDKIHNKYLNYINYDINIKIIINDKNVIIENNKGFNLLYLCIIKKYNNCGIALINKGIDISVLYEKKSLLIESIFNNNYELSFHLLNLNSITYNGEYPIYYLLNQPIINESIFCNLIIKLIGNIQNIGHLLLDLKINKINKIILFNNYNGNSLELNNNIPLIIQSILNNEFEICYILYKKMDNVVYKSLIDKILKDFVSIDNTLLDNKIIIDNECYELIFIIIYLTILFIEEDTIEYTEMKNIWHNTELILNSNINELTEDDIHFTLY